MDKNLKNSIFSFIWRSTLREVNLANMAPRKDYDPDKEHNYILFPFKTPWAYWLSRQSNMETESIEGMGVIVRVRENRETVIRFLSKLEEKNIVGTLITTFRLTTNAKNPFKV